MDDVTPHRRYNPLTGEWVLVSPQRGARPWLGAQEPPPTESRPAYDPKCYLCPGNRRAEGIVNETYTGVWVFDNDFPALLDLPAHGGQGTNELLRRAPQSGICRVICFSPRHDLTLPELAPESIRAVIDTWIVQCEQLGMREDIDYIQLFENKGEMMGCSNPHPHGQLWATRELPTIPALEQKNQADYLAKKGAPLLLDYAQLERAEGERVLFETAHWLALTPFWAVWPFETMLLPRAAHLRRITELSGPQRDDLAIALKELTRRYDALFECSFPYSMGVHQAPFDGEEHPEWQLHLHFYPPLLRSASVRKFLVGYEMLAEAQRDLTPEQAAERLRGL